jgi:hypothetical protein
MLEHCAPDEARGIVARGLNVLDGGSGEYTSEDWELAGIVMGMTDKMRIDSDDLPRYETAAEEFWRAP